MATPDPGLPGVSDVFIPQDIDYPSLRLDVDRERAADLGLNQREVVDNVITALTSNQMIAPSYWVDPKNGNDYMLTVQYPENRVRNLARPAEHSASRRTAKEPTLLDAVTKVTPTLFADRNRPLPDPPRDRHLRQSGRRRSRRAVRRHRWHRDRRHLPPGVRLDMRGMVEGMNASFRSFALG